MAILSPMRYKNYVWPHNPRIYEIEYRRLVAMHKVPFGQYMLQAMGRSNRVLRGEGEFTGPGAYDEFKKLATVFYENTPGLLVHPVWQISNAYLVYLQLRQEPAENYAAYAFEFWESCDIYESGAKQVSWGASDGAVSGAVSGAQAEPVYYTAVSGDCLWNIALAHGLTLQELLDLNPQVKNPNLLYVGDRIRVA